jgi:hypothetical protein
MIAMALSVPVPSAGLAQEPGAREATAAEAPPPAVAPQDSAARNSTGEATAQDSTAQDSTAPDSTAQDSTAQDSTAQDSTAQDSTAPDSTAQDSNAQDSTRGDSAAQEPIAQQSTPHDEGGTRVQEAGARSGCPVTARAVGPIQSGFLDGQLGVAQRACLRDEVAIAEDASLIARPADFYGNIRLGTVISGSFVVTPELAVWGNLEVFRYQTLLSAVGNTYMGLGYLSLGGTYRYYAEHQRALAVYARLVLPTTSGLDRRSQPLALEIGTTAEVSAFENFRFHAFVSALGSLAMSDLAPADPRGGLRVGGGVDWVPYEAFSVVLELASGFGYRDALDFLAVSAGLRFAFGDVIAADLGVTYPFLGAEPSLAAAQLAIRGRFDGRGL